MITETILSDFRKGKKQAYDEIYKSYAPGMYALCMRYTRCVDDAQDVLQEAFIKIYVNREKYKLENPIGAWIKTITINTALSYIKQNYRMKLTDNERDLDQLELPIEDAVDLKVLQQKLLFILNQLPDGYRTVFNLYTVDNLTHKEIAEYLEISESTSKTQYFKAKKMIQLIIEQEKVGHE